MIVKQKNKFKMKKVALLILVCLSLAACNNSKKPEKLLKASLIQEWFPNANYGGELVAMYETDSLFGLDLNVKAGSDQIDPIKLVLSGESEFGVVSADRIIQANEKGADLVVIGVANYKSPTVYLSKKEKNINTVKDFEGKKIGILTGTNTELIYKILVKKNNLDQSKLKEVEAPFDLATFIAGEYDVRPGFAYDEPVSLEQQGIEFNTIKPEDYGVKFLGTVYFCKRSLVEQKPELVKAFVQSIKSGWEKTFANPVHAIDLLYKYDSDIDKGRETKSLAKALEYFKGENDSLLYASKESWETMANDLKEMGFIKTFDYSKTVNNSFLIPKE